MFAGVVTCSELECRVSTWDTKALADSNVARQYGQAYSFKKIFEHDHKCDYEYIRYLDIFDAVVWT